MAASSEDHLEKRGGRRKEELEVQVEEIEIGSKRKMGEEEN